MKKQISKGTVHDVPLDLEKVLTADSAMHAAWEDISPLARNEWICWIVTNKKPETRSNHLKRAQEELKKGKRRPCCWSGCVHRTDKAMSPSQKFVIARKKL